ncbi:MAG TPA: hypothetical protein VIG57_21360 [Candidatus Entotheonella sp.]
MMDKEVVAGKHMAFKRLVGMGHPGVHGGMGYHGHLCWWRHLS